MFWPAVILYVRFFFTKGWKRLYGPWISPPFAKRHAVRVVLVFASSGICPYVLHPLRNPVDPVRPRPCMLLRGPHVSTHLRYLMNLSESQYFAHAHPPSASSLLHSQDPPARLGIFMNRSLHELFLSPYKAPPPA